MCLVVACLLIAARCPAGDGKFDQNDLILHVYYDQRQAPATLIGTGGSFDGTWKDYFRKSAVHYYDAHEGLSRIKRIYLYNAVADGKTKADIFVTNDGPSANPGGFGKNALYVFLPRDFHTRGLASSHYITTLAHELTHYVYNITDSYGGQLYYEDIKMPLEYLTRAEQQSPFGAGGTRPDGLNFRTYMWTNEWLKYRVPGLTGPASAGGKLFYELSGKPSVAGGVPDRGSLMSTPVNTTLRDSEYSTSISHVLPADYSFQMPAYRYVNSSGVLDTMPADNIAFGYKLSNNQHDKHQKGEWPMVLAYHAAAGRNWALPATFAKQTFTTESQYPEVILVDAAALVLCLDTSGSMADENRMDLAKAGARAAIGQLRARTPEGIPGHFAGVVSFSDYTTVNAWTQEVLSDATRSTFNAAVGNLSPYGATSIGGGLRTSLEELLDHPDKARAIILLSDGEHNAGESPSSVIPDLVANSVKVYTIAVGDGADFSTLGSIASQTGGEMRYGESATSLRRFFVDLFSKLSGAGATTTSDIQMDPGDVYEESVFSESGCNRLVVMLSSEAGGLGYHLIRPDGSLVTSSTVDPKISYRSASGDRVFEVRDPAPGTWRASVSSPAGSGWGPFTKTESPAKPINDNTTIESQLVASSPASIEEIHVDLNLTHTYIGDLTVTLRAPSGTEVILHNRTGGGTDNLVGTYGVDLVPSQLLEAFGGQPVAGTWTLRVQDSSGGDTGALNSWGIRSTNDSTGPASVSVTVNNPSIAVDGEASPAVYPAPMKIEARVSGYGGAISGAEVNATISGPAGSSSRIPLRDDGSASNGDANAMDGIYSALFSGYRENGVHDIAVEVVCNDAYVAQQSDELLPGDRPIQNAVPPFARTFALQATTSNVSDINFVTIDALECGFSAKTDQDSMSIKGRFNMEAPAGFNPLTQTIGIGLGSGAAARTWSLAGPWKQVGRLQKYAFKQGTGSAVVSYFIGGSSRSTFSFKTGGASLAGLRDQKADLAVDFDMGSWAESLRVTLDDLGRSLKFGGKMPEARLVIDTLGLKKQTKGVNKDSVVFAGRLLGPAWLNPATDGLVLSFGGLTVTVPSGGFKVKGTKATFATSGANGAIKLSYDTENRLVKCALSGISLAGITAANPIQVSASAVGGTGVSFEQTVKLAAKGNSLSY